MWRNIIKVLKTHISQWIHLNNHEMFVDNGPVAWKTPYEWCIQNYQKVPLLLEALLHS
jgi:hypothetical protein